MNDLAPTLRPTAADHANDGLQTLSSAVDLVAPGAGSFFGALVGQIIPHQRQERLAEFATRLGRRLRVAEGAVSDLTDRYEELARSLSEQQRALFEDGAVAAAKATSPERIDHIAKVVADGLQADDLKAIEQRRLLNLLNDLSEEDIIVLTSHTYHIGRASAWREQHEAILSPIRAHMQAAPEVHDRDTMRKLRTRRLLNLGVLEEKQSAGGRSVHNDLSPLGRYVLRQLGVLGPEEL